MYFESNSLSGTYKKILERNHLFKSIKSVSKEGQKFLFANSLPEIIGSSLKYAVPYSVSTDVEIGTSGNMFEGAISDIGDIFGWGIGADAIASITLPARVTIEYRIVGRTFYVKFANDWHQDCLVALAKGHSGSWHNASSKARDRARSNAREIATRQILRVGLTLDGLKNAILKSITLKGHVVKEYLEDLEKIVITNDYYTGYLFVSPIPSYIKKSEIVEGTEGKIPIEVSSNVGRFIVNFFLYGSSETSTCFYQSNRPYFPSDPNDRFSTGCYAYYGNVPERGYRSFGNFKPGDIRLQASGDESVFFSSKGLDYSKEEEDGKLFVKPVSPSITETSLFLNVAKTAGVFRSHVKIIFPKDEYA